MQEDVRGTSMWSFEWNYEQPKPAYLRPFPHIRITTELRTVVPRVDLMPLVAKAPTADNAWAVAPVLATLPIEVPANVSKAFAAPVFLPITALEKSGLVANVAEPSRASYAMAPGSVAALAQLPLPADAPLLDLAGTEDLGLRVEPLNTAKAIRDVFNVEPFPRRPSLVGVLLEQAAEAARLKRDRLTESVKHRLTQIEDFLGEVQRRIDELIIPRPALVPGAVPTRGRATGYRGEVKPKELIHVPAVVFDRTWEPERTMLLPVEVGPEIGRGRLRLALRVEEVSLVGRLADLVLVAKDVEVVLTSATVERGRKENSAQVVFDLDLATAGLRVRDGAFPTDVLRVLIEPKRGRNAERHSDTGEAADTGV